MNYLGTVGTFFSCTYRAIVFSLKDTERFNQTCIIFFIDHFTYKSPSLSNSVHSNYTIHLSIRSSTHHSISSFPLSTHPSFKLFLSFIHSSIIQFIPFIYPYFHPSNYSIHLSIHNSISSSTLLFYSSTNSPHQSINHISAVFIYPSTHFHFYTSRTKHCFDN